MSKSRKVDMADGYQPLVDKDKDLEQGQHEQKATEQHTEAHSSTQSETQPLAATSKSGKPENKEYNAEVIKYFDSALTSAIAVDPAKLSKERILELMKLRESTKRGDDISKAHPWLGIGSEQQEYLSGFYNLFDLSVGVTTGGTMLQQEKECGVPNELMGLSAFFVAWALKSSALNSLDTTYLKIAGVKRAIGEELQNKGLMQESDFNQLNNSAASWFEHAATLAAIGMLIKASTMIRDKSAYTSVVGWSIGSVVLEILASMINMMSKVRFAQELGTESGIEFDSRKVPFSDAFRTCVYTGGASALLGFLVTVFQVDKISNDSSANHAASITAYTGIGTALIGFLVMAGLGARVRGSDYINYRATDELKLGDSSKRIQSSLCGRYARTDVLDFVSGSGLAVIWAGMINAMLEMHDRNFQMIALTSLAMYFAGRGQLHSYARSKTQDWMFWKELKAFEHKQEDAGPRQERPIRHDFFSKFTKTNWSCSSVSLPELNLEGLKKRNPFKSNP